MPTLSEFLNTLERSRLVDRSRVDRVRRKLPERDRDDLAVVIRAMVEHRLLTKFQATNILAGKSGPFFIGKYRILDELGKGGMGKVYYARHVESRRKAAIKVLPKKRAAAERNALARFRREADVSLRLFHPNIAETIEVGEDAGVHFMVMEYIPGQNLYDMVQKGGPLRVWDAARLFGEVAYGLGHIHQLGIVHRDIKPSNIMVTPEGKAKLLDLGLARASDEEVDQLTSPGMLVGTLDYIPPEQTSGNAVPDARGDIYSLGCTLYFALSRTMPFGGGTVKSKIYRHRMEEPEPLEKITQHVPKEFAALVRKMMAKDPADRYASAEELAHDLDRWRDPDRVRSLLGAAAESGQVFHAPPPEIDSAELHVDEGLSLRSLGTDQPSEAAAPRTAKAAAQPAPAGAAAPPTPMRRIKAQRSTEPRDTSSQFIVATIVVIAALGILAIIIVTFWDHLTG